VRGRQKQQEKIVTAVTIDKLVKSQKTPFLSFRRKPESSNFNMFWIPDQIRHDVSGTFYECIAI